MSFARAGVDLIMTGHTHVASASTIVSEGKRMILCTAGTASSTRHRGEAPSFNLIEHRGNTIEVSIFASAPDAGQAIQSYAFHRANGDWTKLERAAVRVT